MANTKVLLSDQLLLSSVGRVPPNYIRPVYDRPDLFAPVADEKPSDVDGSIPLIDLQDLDGPRRSHVIKQIAGACETDGFFQVKNHGVPEPAIENMLRAAREFFHLPESERLKCYSDDPFKPMRLSTSFNVKSESIGSWRDYLRLHCHPLQDCVPDWPSNPPSFRESAADYCSNVRGLALRLLEAISESLGLEREYIDKKALGKHGQHMAINFYPPCPQPELTYGLPAHADPNVITILLQDQVPGLQVCRNGKWVGIRPAPNTFIVNIADQIQVISNGKYKSAVHRAVVNCDAERISIPTFYCPSPDAVIMPAPQLVDNDHPALYRSYAYSEYYHEFWNRGLTRKTCLDKFVTTTTSSTGHVEATP